MVPPSTFVLCALGGWVFWKLFRGYFTRSPLDNIPGPRRASLLKGNAHQLFNRHAWGFHERISQEYGQVVKFHAPFGGRGLYVFDPKALYHMIVKDIATFDEPRWFLQMADFTFGPGLFSTSGQQHRKHRRVLNPVFSINHMRNLAPLFYTVAHRLRDGLSTQLTTSTGGEVEILGWMGRAALELVGQGGFCHSFDQLDKNVPNAYRDVLKEVIPSQIALHFWRILLPYAVEYVPARIRRFLAPWLPHPVMQKYRNICITMDEQARAIYHAKKVALEQGDKLVEHQACEGRDILSVLMTANKQESVEDRLSEEEVIALISTLAFAATDTTSNAMARILHLLAEHQHVQDKMRLELFEAGMDGEDIPYDRLVELPYLDAVCRETLRLYPPVLFMNRETRQDAVLPLSKPIQGLDGDVLTEIMVPKGTLLMVSIVACNRNKALWGEDVLEWKPERWLSPLPESIREAHVPGVYSHLLTFLGGGRACIGSKFAQLEMKVLLCTLLRSYRFMPGTKGVYWNVGAISYPTPNEIDEKAAMYLTMDHIQAPQ